MVTIIAAAAENDALGKDNDLVWHLPDDFKRFKEMTSGHHIIMGRKTFESLPGLLPNRQHIVVSRSTNYQAKGVIVVATLEKALEAAKSDPTPFIIGGGEIYTLGFQYADCIELTRVHAVVEADTYFPIIDTNDWKLVKEEFHPRNDRHKYAFTYLTYHKI